MIRQVQKELRPRRRGFTIVEAVVLIAIVGILGSIAAPRFLALSDMDAARAHRQALSDFRYAQRLATASGCPVQISFGTENYTFTKRTNCRTGPFTLPIINPATNAAPYQVTLPPNLTITSTLSPLVFDSLGRTTASSGVVQNASVSLGGRSIQVIGESGFVRIP